MKAETEKNIPTPQRIVSLKTYLHNAGKIACVLTCLWFFLNILFFDTYSFFVYFSSSERLKKLSESNESLLNQNNQLEIEIERLKNDPLFIERIARHNYTMVKEGETVYIFRKN
ncbi:MAG: septum formation initiator family protein [Candidatus Cloacimonetes bacterium]|nr:septum formation initiator family protein [Candidatus Cloacimonadota bacterium]